MTPNLYGNLVANTAAGIAGGTGVMPGGKSIYILKFRAHILICCILNLNVEFVQSNCHSIYKNIYWFQSASLSAYFMH